MVMSKSFLILILILILIFCTAGIRIRIKIKNPEWPPKKVSCARRDGMTKNEGLLRFMGVGRGRRWRAGGGGAGSGAGGLCGDSTSARDSCSGGAVARPGSAVNNASGFVTGMRRNSSAAGKSSRLRNPKYSRNNRRGAVGHRDGRPLPPGPLARPIRAPAASASPRPPPRRGPARFPPASGAGGRR